MIRRAYSALLLVGAVCCLAVGCEQLGSPTARQRLLAEVLLERAGHLDGSVRHAVARALVRTEDQYSVDALLLIAVAEEESHFRPRAKSRRGALGLMQIRPATASDVAERHGIAYRHAKDLYDPAVSLAIGAAYLAELEESFGSWELALGAYHRGPRNLRQAIARGRTARSRYVARVMDRWRGLQETVGRSGLKGAR